MRPSGKVASRASRTTWSSNSARRASPCTPTRSRTKSPAFQEKGFPARTVSASFRNAAPSFTFSSRASPPVTPAK